MHVVWLGNNEYDCNAQLLHDCALVLVRAPQDPQPLIADGLWYGRVIATPRGAGGFGYDPHFLLPERGDTRLSA